MKMENQDGKRVARGPGMPRGGKIALAVVLVLVLALAGGYVGLCAYAGTSSVSVTSQVVWASGSEHSSTARVTASGVPVSVTGTE